MMKLKRRAITLFIWLLFATGGSAQAGFSNAYIIGDSLSDAGNLASLPGFEFLLTQPYDDGFSNGPRAVEILAGYLGLSADPSLHLVGPTVGTNYAVAGARAAGDDFIDLGAQLGVLLYDQAGSVPSDALYVVFIGSNDIRDARDAHDMESAHAIIANAAHAIEQAVRTLLQAGAEAILVVNAPDIGLLPETRMLAELSGDRRLVRQTTRLTRDFNRQLAMRLRGVERDMDTDLVEFDLFSSFQFVMSNNDALRFTNTTDACFSSVTFTFDPDCLDGDAFDSFIFFDEIHPAARMHERAGRALYSVVPEPAESAN